MKICFFGDYDPTYVRTKVVLDGLASLGYSVVHVNARGPGKYRRLYRQYRALRPDSHDVIFAAFGDSRMMSIFAQLISKKPVIWDPLFSLYDNWVFDRRFVSPTSLKARYYWFIDWLGACFSDHIVLDTMTNAQYFSDEFNVPMEKFSRVLTGGDPTVFTPLPPFENTDIFEVEFHGKYIPVHGVDVLIRAAKILETYPDIHFTLIGKGQTLEESRALVEELKLKNVTFVPFVPIRDLIAYLRRSHVTIGLVGDVPRVVRAIPGKMYEASAARRLTINADTPALREIYKNGCDCVGVKQGDPDALAQAILTLRNDRESLHKMAEEAYKTYMRSATPECIAKELLAACGKATEK